MKLVWQQSLACTERPTSKRGVVIPLARQETETGRTTRIRRLTRSVAGRRMAVLISFRETGAIWWRPETGGPTRPTLHGNCGRGPYLAVGSIVGLAADQDALQVASGAGPGILQDNIVQCETDDVCCNLKLAHKRQSIQSLQTHAELLMLFGGAAQTSFDSA